MLDNILIHWGVKGMKWGVRKDRGTSKRQLRNEERYLTKGHSRSEATRLAKRRIRNQNIAITAGAITAAAAATYVAADILNAKSKLKQDIKRTNIGLEHFEKADELMTKGEEFVRASFLKNDAWSNPVRTYAIRGTDVSKVSHYGNKFYSLSTNQRSRIAGIQTQLETIKSSDSKAIRDSYLRDLLRGNTVGRAVVSRSSKDDVAKGVLSYINRTGYGAASDSSEKITSTFVNSLLDRGYSAVRDTNHAHIPAYVLLNKSLFDISNR